MKCFARTKISPALIGIIAIIMSTTAFGYTIYVDVNAAGADIGTDWNNALRSLQEAIAIAYWLPKPVEIHVARGVYRPDQGAGITPGDRETPFFVLSGIAIRGGYAGRSYSNPDERDIERYKTILSGDLLGNDTDIDDPFDLPWAENRGDNSINVVVSYEADNTGVLDGVTVRGGYNYELLAAYGAGMYCHYGSPTITDCIFEDNFAGDIASIGEGAGMSTYYSNATLTNCTFRKNCTGYMGLPSIMFPAAVGGGLANVHSDPVLEDCVFERNYCFDGGGAIFNYDSEPEIINCIFNANHALGMGGAMYNSESKVEMTNCPVTLSSAVYGGAVHSESSDMTMTNCTFADNYSMHGGNGFWCDSYVGYPVSNLDFTNCILWDGEEQILNDDGSDITINFSDVQGGWSGSGGSNINADPLFAEHGFWAHIDDSTIILEPNDPNAVDYAGDYHLKSESGRWDPISRSWVMDDVTSPCVDAGDPASNWTRELWPHGGRINMGTYGGTDKASMSGEAGEISLPSVAFIYSTNTTTAESFESLLESNGMSVTLIDSDDIASVSLGNYGLIIVGDDTSGADVWDDEAAVNAIGNSGRPVVGVGRGGYDLFGELDLFIGSPHGRDDDTRSIYVVNPELSLFSRPSPISIPDDQVLDVYSSTDSVNIFLPSERDGIVSIGRDVSNSRYYPLLIEQNKYTLWGFRRSPGSMTEVGKTLFVNVVVWTANGGG